MKTPMPLQSLLLICASLSLLACGRAPSSAPAASLQLSPCASTERGALQQASYAECGQLAVPINPQNPSSPPLHLHLLRLKTLSPNPAPDPLMVIAGGPGQSAIKVAQTLAPLFEDVRKQRDILFIDQRGTGQSNALNCPLPTETLDALGEEAQQALLKTALPPCAQQHQALIPYLTTPYAVQDLEAVRIALGYPKVNLWGGSYGSRVALEYLRQFPTSVRSAILDGLAPAILALPSHMAEDAQAAFNRLAQQCLQQPQCQHTLGDIREHALSLSKQLSQTPLQLTIPHPRTRQPIAITLTQTDFAYLVRMGLYSREVSSLIPMAIHGALNQQPQLLAALIFLAKEKGGETDLDIGMHYSVVCNEDLPLFDNTPPPLFLNVPMANTYRAICAFWPKAPPHPLLAQPVQSDVPSLFLSGAQDPVTPPKWAEWAAQGFSQALRLTAPGGHHLVSKDGCVPQLMAQFIHLGRIQGLDTQCIQQIQPLPIQLPIGAPKAASTTKDAILND